MRYTNNPTGTKDRSGQTNAGDSYTYDAAEQRTRVVQSGAATEYYFFGGTLMATQNVATGAWTDMIYAGSLRIAEVAGTQAATPVFNSTPRCFAVGTTWTPPR